MKPPARPRGQHSTNLKPSRLSPRQAALETLLEVGRGAHLDAALDARLRQIERPEDRGLATTIAYGTLRWRGQIDPVLAGLSSRPIDTLDRRLLEAARIGLFQLMYLSRVPHHAAVAETVALIPEQHLRNFANGVLREAARRVEKGDLRYSDTSSPETLARTASLPLWYVRRLWHRLGPEAAVRAAEALNQTPPVFLRINTLKITREGLLDRLRVVGTEPAACAFSPAGIELNGARAITDQITGGGFAFIQDEASQMVPLLVDPKPGEKILDLCAAPGGKTLGLALLSGGKAEITAVDRSAPRLKRIDTLARSLAIPGIRTMQADVSAPVPGLAPQSFDRVLVDPPCSAMGTLHRNPDARWTRREEDLPLYAATQRKILEQGWNLLKPGGRLVYSVCTVEPEETTGVTGAFLAAHADARPVPVTRAAAGLAAETAARISTREGHFRMTPWDHRTDGFFAAVLGKD
ncbi:MAG: 16S rRNA (cytosine(967)-C(5))-methyltransferase RsmB [Deltaproteobacteria bacterium]|nr:16S rRNA (cytosine(967)-C(5))-methyltransferase RsmB [Deltaproteobacteria bacterium]